LATDIEISTDPNRIDIPLVHAFLSNSYWARGRPLGVVEKSIRYSLCFGAYAGDHQVGFARLITDRAVFAYLADVFIIPEYRGLGVSRMLLEAILQHPETRDVRLFRLGTRDAHGLYEKYGFRRMIDPEKSMELFVDAVDQ
jgi:GNAT superfamily N-acetyltransferase